MRNRFLLAPIRFGLNIPAQTGRGARIPAKPRMNRLVWRAAFSTGVRMSANPRLEVLLPKLFEALLREGFTLDQAALICTSVRKKRLPPRIKSQDDYVSAWTVCHATEEVLITLDDGSAVAVWCSALASRVIEYEDAYLASQGHRPLNPGGPEWTVGPTGSA
jgi:hypothetical protein